MAAPQENPQVFDQPPYTVNGLTDTPRTITSSHSAHIQAISLLADEEATIARRDSIWSDSWTDSSATRQLDSGPCGVSALPRSWPNQLSSTLTLSQMQFGFRGKIFQIWRDAESEPTSAKTHISLMENARLLLMMITQLSPDLTFQELFMNPALIHLTVYCSQLLAFPELYWRSYLPRLVCQNPVCALPYSYLHCTLPAWSIIIPGNICSLIWFHNISLCCLKVSDWIPAQAYYTY